MILLIIIVAIIATFLIYDPDIDIMEDKIVLWYNYKNNREYFILWRKLIKTTALSILAFILYSIGLELVSAPSYIENILGIFVMIGAFFTIYTTILKNKKNE